MGKRYAEYERMPLDPCPFCGAEAVLVELHDDYAGNVWRPLVNHLGHCPMIGARPYEETPMEMIHQWNRRSHG